MAIAKTLMLVLTIFQPIYWSFYIDFLTDEGKVSFVLAILDTEQDHWFFTSNPQIYHLPHPDTNGFLFMAPLLLVHNLFACFLPHFSSPGSEKCFFSQFILDY